MAQRNIRTGEPLSASTVVSTLGMLKAFFIWLSGEAGYSRVKQADAEYFNPPDNLSRVATARRHKPCASLKQIRAVLDAMPTATEIERRDRALIAFTILTGARDRAIVSFRLKHIDLEQELLEQDARQVHTKDAKTFIELVFPRGRRHSKNRGRLGDVLAERKRLRPGRPDLPQDARRQWPGHAISCRRIGARALGNRQPGSRGLQGGVCKGGPALFQPAQLSEIRFSKSPMTSNSTPNSSRRGRRILVMTTV